MKEQNSGHWIEERTETAWDYQPPIGRLRLWISNLWKWEANILIKLGRMK